MNLSVRYSQVLPTLLLTIGLLVSATPAQAQNINGIFGTRSSEQFFLEGIERLEREIDDLQDGSNLETDPLRIDPSIEEHRQRIEQQNMPQDDRSSADTATFLQSNQAL